MCLMSIYGTHHNPDIWPDPQVEPLGHGGIHPDMTMGQQDVTLGRDNHVPTA